jgi:threonine dehydrogenase-like Zn-dependent dehydrogenase
MTTMRALVRRGNAVSLEHVPIPEPESGEVRVRVAVAGLCRTDLLVAAGRIPAVDPVVLGHEFAGTVDALGPGVASPDTGVRVAVRPVLPCGRCAVCREDPINCSARRMLGADRDGAFAEFAVVPADCVYPIPERLSFLAAAYAEPIAAALAVFRAGILPHHHGAILGKNRFATLVERLLARSGFREMVVCDAPHAEQTLAEGTFDFVIETGLSTRTAAEMIRLAKPRGTVILKSRQPGVTGVDFSRAIVKNLTIRTVNYGSFHEALSILAGGEIDLEGLLGPVHALEDFAEVFELARERESAKVFLTPDRHDVRNS